MTHTAAALIASRRQSPPPPPPPPPPIATHRCAGARSIEHIGASACARACDRQPTKSTRRAVANPVHKCKRAFRRRARARRLFARVLACSLTTAVADDDDDDDDNDDGDNERWLPRLPLLPSPSTQQRAPFEVMTCKRVSERQEGGDKRILVFLARARRLKRRKSSRQVEKRARARAFARSLLTSKASRRRSSCASRRQVCASFRLSLSTCNLQAQHFFACGGGPTDLTRNSASIFFFYLLHKHVKQRKLRRWRRLVSDDGDHAARLRRCMRS